MALFGDKNRPPSDATRDALTGLLTADAITAECVKAIEAANGGEHVAIGVVAFDGFRDLSNKQGNLVADHLLRELGPRLSEGVRDVDFVGRISRDEFIVVFRQLTGRLQTLALVSRFRIHVGEPVKTGTGPYKPIVNIGLAHPPADGTTTEALFEVAEKAMFVMQDETREAARREAVQRVTTARTAVTTATANVAAAEQAVRDADAHLIESKKLLAEAKAGVTAALENAKALGVAVETAAGR